MGASLLQRKTIGKQTAMKNRGDMIQASARGRGRPPAMGKGPDCRCRVNL
jgi:hypothetical protein